MNFFEFLAQYFWVIMILLSFVRAVSIKRHSGQYIEANPALASGYVTLTRGYLVWTNIPWVVMGIGCTIGGVPSVFCFFSPRAGNPYVVAWFLSVFLIWILGTYWIFFNGGAEMLVQHPGVLEANISRRWPLGTREPISSTWVLKLIWLLCLAGGVLGVILMWTQHLSMCGLRI